MARKHPTCQYPRTGQTPEDYLVRLVGQLQVNDQLRLKLDPHFRCKPITFKRLKRCENFREVEPQYLENLLRNLLSTRRLYVTNGAYHLPQAIVPQYEVTSPKQT